ncbi:hypothetical protein [Erythrobacter sp. THAF29]|uniref:hypothetical protein n=1 Tax=Erythrobacter sp. THAF29 TaxID=2587851 RepID=UPI001267D34B|nr:hypothetical protein [Erythrobacter sp. THAF29]QFT75914.1 hypothetical protein FIU90_00025 [Erythrobacter sp. THAF29]
MSYAAPRGPKLFFGLIAGTVLGFFAWVIGAELAKQFYRTYQFHQIERCESEFGLRQSDKRANFGFDAGGWTVVGDEPRKLEFVECVRDRLSVSECPASNSPYPAIEVAWSSILYSPNVYVSYYPAEAVQSDKSTD